MRHCITVGFCKVLSVWLVNIHVHSYINIQIHIHIQVHMFIKIHLDIHINIGNDNNNTNSNRKSNMKRNCTLLFVDWMLETGVELEDPPTSPRILLVLELNFISVSVCFPHFLICSSCDHPLFIQKRRAPCVELILCLLVVSLIQHVDPSLQKINMPREMRYFEPHVKATLAPNAQHLLILPCVYKPWKIWLQSLRMQETQLNRCMRLRSLSIFRHVTRITSWSMRHVGMYPKIQWIATFVSL